MVGIRAWFCFVLVAGTVAGCGKVKSAESDAAPDDQCLPTQTLCSTECVDTQSSHANCGGCNETCDSIEVCDQGECVASCSGNLTACDGACVDTEANDLYCGSCTNACNADQVCRSGVCDDLDTTATLQITSAWPDVTGWVSPVSQPIVMNFADPGLAGVVFECRTGPESIIGSLSFVNCDGGDGSGTSYRPSPVVNMEEGSYRTDVRLRRGAWVSAVQSHEFYVHHSLDGVDDCDFGFTDAQIFAKAASELDTAPTFDPSTVVKRPFIHIPFKNITVNFGLKNSGGAWNNVNTGDAFDVDVLALRRRFALSADSRFLLVHRVYESRMHRRQFDISSCANRFSFGTRAKRDCPFFVLNSRGEGVCLAPDPVNAGVLVNTRGAGNSFDEGWVKLGRRDDYHPAFYGKRTTPCPAGGCQSWEISLPE